MERTGPGIHTGSSITGERCNEIGRTSPVGEAGANDMQLLAQPSDVSRLAGPLPQHLAPLAPFGNAGMPHLFGPIEAVQQFAHFHPQMPDSLSPMAMQTPMDPREAASLLLRLGVELAPLHQTGAARDVNVVPGDVTRVDAGQRLGTAPWKKLNWGGTTFHIGGNYVRLIEALVEADDAGLRMEDILKVAKFVNVHGVPLRHPGNISHEIQKRLPGLIQTPGRGCAGVYRILPEVRAQLVQAGLGQARAPSRQPAGTSSGGHGAVPRDCVIPRIDPNAQYSARDSSECGVNSRESTATGRVRAAALAFAEMRGTQVWTPAEFWEHLTSSGPAGIDRNTSLSGILVDLARKGLLDRVGETRNSHYSKPALAPANLQRAKAYAPEPDMLTMFIADNHIMSLSEIYESYPGTAESTVRKRVNRLVKAGDLEFAKDSKGDVVKGHFRRAGSSAVAMPKAPGGSVNRSKLARLELPPGVPSSELDWDIGGDEPGGMFGWMNHEISPHELQPRHQDQAADGSRPQPAKRQRVVHSPDQEPVAAVVPAPMRD